MGCAFSSSKYQTKNRNTANNLVSPNTVGLKTQTSHTVGFEITATPHKKLLTPQHRKSPCPAL